jgi:hypothetical protein
MSPWSSIEGYREVARRILSDFAFFVRIQFNSTLYYVSTYCLFASAR